MTKKILIVAAHPDDEVLGCGATIAKLTQKGYEAHLLIVGEGKASRPNIKNDPKNLAHEIAQLEIETADSCKVLGIKSFVNAGFADNQFDSVPLLKIVQKIEEIKTKIKPEIIFTHHFGDMNVDHQIVHRAVLTATRPMEDECVKEIYSFEVPSSTEWNSFERGTIFVPNVFVDVTATIDLKVEAMAKYHSELRDFPHPRSLRHIKELAAVNGTKVGLAFSENFSLVRSVKKTF